MAMLETDFTNVIESFAAIWQRSSESGGRSGDKNGWEDVRVLERFGTRYLQITKLISATAEQSAESHEETGGASIEEDDPEALVPSTTAKHHRELAVRYDIAYSPAYQVPILYITFTDPGANKPIPLPSPDEIYKLLVPDDFKCAMREVGIMGALSMSDHPITGVPAYFVHPCRTQEALAPLLGPASSKSGERGGLKYLLFWFGMIGSSVGLSVPVHVARLFAEKEAELEKC